MRKIILFSGGIDSTTLLWRERRSHEVLALAFDYGQPHRVELDRASRLADIIDEPYRELRIPSLEAQGVVFPARNTIFIALALAVALAEFYDAIVIGAHRDDAERFPDCRPGFITAMRAVIISGYPGGPVLEAPFLGSSKVDIVREAKALGVPLEITWSCYGAGPDPCGTCLACQARQTALA